LRSTASVSNSEGSKSSKDDATDCMKSSGNRFVSDNDSMLVLPPDTETSDNKTIVVAELLEIGTAFV